MEPSVKLSDLRTQIRLWFDPIRPVSAHEAIARQASRSAWSASSWAGVRVWAMLMVDELRPRRRF